MSAINFDLKSTQRYLFLACYEMSFSSLSQQVMQCVFCNWCSAKSCEYRKLTVNLDWLSSRSFVQYWLTIRTYFYFYIQTWWKTQPFKWYIAAELDFYFWLEFPMGHFCDLLGRREKLIPKDPSKSEYHLPGVRFHQNRRHTTFGARWHAADALWCDSNFIHCCCGKCSKVQTP